MKSVKAVAASKFDVCAIDRYDILLALMESSQTQNVGIKSELSKIMRDIALLERETRQYVKTVDIEVSGNEELLEYIRRLA